MKEFKRIPIRFYTLDSIRSPVEDWKKSLPKVDRNRINIEVRKVAMGFRLRKGNFRKLSGYSGLWEIRYNLTQKRTTRLLFCINNNTLLLLNGFLKTTQKTPSKDLELAVT